MRDRAARADIRIKVKRVEAHADEAHGGVWKMVYADFMTAMMAFFLVLWLATTASQAQRDLLADYFNPVAISRSNSGADGALDGRSVDTIGALSSPAAPQERAFPVASPPVIAELGQSDAPPTTKETRPNTDQKRPAGGEDAASKRAFDQVEERIRESLATDPRLTGLARAVVFQRRIDGLYIQLTETEAYEMFRPGSDLLTDRASSLLRAVGGALHLTPHKVRISGHTDASPYKRANDDFANWTLSSLRANAARTALSAAGVPNERIDGVEGLADTDPLNSDDLTDPVNRRITIAVLRKVPASFEIIKPDTN